jgi:hypothetical protein
MVWLSYFHSYTRRRQEIEKTRVRKKVERKKIYLTERKPETQYEEGSEGKQRDR